ncbi:ABC transporter ATP-binding protein [Clostridium sporogenes]|uniref:ABC transporter ATP-binding protein n=1 Tax=Clostridium sporogenes TaxID=1509 RepID=UPI0006B2A3E9|nr:ABC transporter ATP-binding protein [Clostridium sporogenes]KOY67208.1 hypothetical protein AN649_03945 [Clostridium sporogenes]MDS1008291.1 ABC transporter ATP-binding protein [Clostridium sporogenes]
MNKKKFSLFIINLLKPYSKKIILLFLVTIFTILFDLSQPIISKNIIDGALKNYNYQLLLYFLGILIVITILGLLLSYIQKSTINKIEEKIKYDIRLQIFKCILNHDINFFKDKDVGELMSRMLGETSDIIRFLLNSTMNILMNIIYILILIIIMFSLNSIIALVNLLFGIITLFLLIKTGTRINVKQEKVIKKFSEISNNINESIFNIKTIKYLGIYTYVLNKIKKVLNEDYNLNIKYKIFVITINTFLFLVIFIPNIFLWGYGGYLVVNHVMTIGSLIALSNYFQKFMSNINELKSLNVEFQKFIIMCKRLEEIINNYIEADSIFLLEENSINTVNNITLENVSFGYNKEIFSNINITFSLGEVIKISGSNAIGKTTLINILIGLIIPQSGTILINGEKTYNIQKLINSTNLFGVVPQNIQLFSNTVKENIYLDSNYSDQNIISLAEKIGFEGITMDFLNKKVINRGLNLSGGQQQKIAILRALIKNPQIIILDEASSNLDNKNKEALYKYIYETRSNKISLIITHDNIKFFTKELNLKYIINQ